MFYGFILGMDTFVLGLIKAAEIIEDGRIDEFVKTRYSSFENEIGKKIRSDNSTLEEIASYAEKKGKAELPISGRQEYLENILNSIIFN